MPTNTKALQVAEPVAQIAGKNAVINGGFDIWQRGTSFPFVAGELYTADRWYVFRGGFVTGATISRQNSGLAGSRYCFRMQRDSGNTSTQTLYATYTMESQDSIPLAGQTITFSFYARAGANYSGGAFTGRVLYGTGIDQRVTTFTGIQITSTVSATLTTSWQRFTGTATINSAATEIGFDFGYTPSGTAGANDYVEISEVQFELGSTATPFSRAGGTIQGELAACQRYYVRWGGSNVYERIALGIGASATVAKMVVNQPVAMRVAPTSIDYSNISVYDTATITACSSVTINAAGTLTTELQANVASGLTAFRPYQLMTNGSTNYYLGLSAEL